MTIEDWLLAAAGIAFIAWLIYLITRLHRWAERDLDDHIETATALANNTDLDEARRRHPATRSLAAPACDKCDAPGPAREHIHRSWR